MLVIDIIKVIVPSALAFFIGIALTPIVSHYLYRYKAWKKKGGKGAAIGGGGTPIFDELHKEREVGTPRMGGIVIWASAAFTIIGLWSIAVLFPTETTQKLDFLSRSQTWIPLFTLLAGAFVGLFDDILEVVGSRSNAAGGFSLGKRLVIVGTLATFVGWWFHDKLEVSSLGLPFLPDIQLGILFLPFFILVTWALYAGGVIDGIDGLAGGVFAAAFSAYAGIAFYQQQIDLAAFCAMLVGAILAFLWFNIPPARFYMSETGTMGLTITLAVVAFMTDSIAGGHGVLVLPVIAMPLVVTVLSNVLQVGSKRLRGGKKVFRVAPIHHHFEAIGWPSYKVTMRYWVLSVVFAVLGLLIALIG